MERRCRIQGARGTRAGGGERDLVPGNLAEDAPDQHQSRGLPHCRGAPRGPRGHKCLLRLMGRGTIHRPEKATLAEETGTFEFEVVSTQISSGGMWLMRGWGTGK